MKSSLFISLIAVTTLSAIGENHTKDLIAAWKSKPPKDCPFAASVEIPSCEFTGRHANYSDADTWYPSWGADDQLYSPFTDTIGKGVNGVYSSSGGGKGAVVGHATIVGEDPLALSVINPGTIASPGDQ